MKRRAMPAAISPQWSIVARSMGSTISLPLLGPDTQRRDRTDDQDHTQRHEGMVVYVALLPQVRLAAGIGGTRKRGQATKTTVIHKRNGSRATPAISNTIPPGGLASRPPNGKDSSSPIGKKSKNARINAGIERKKAKGSTGGNGAYLGLSAIRSQYANQVLGQNQTQIAIRAATTAVTISRLTIRQGNHTSAANEL